MSSPLSSFSSFSGNAVNSGSSLNEKKLDQELRHALAGNEVTTPQYKAPQPQTFLRQPAPSFAPPPTSGPRPPLTSLKKSVPLRIWFAISAITLVVLGLLSAMILINLNQDTRQQASTGTPYPCSNYGSQPECYADNRCMWNGSSCIAKPTPTPTPQPNTSTPTPTPTVGTNNTLIPDGQCAATIQRPIESCQSGTTASDGTCSSGLRCGRSNLLNPKTVVGPNSCVDLNTQVCPTGITPQFVSMSTCTTQYRCTIVPSTPPPELSSLCSTSGEEVCQQGFIYRCSTPFTRYQKTSTVCGEGTANVGAVVNCCINSVTERKTIAACQQGGGRVGVCASQANVCVTAFGEVPYGESRSGDCSTQGVKTVISCSSTGIVSSSQSREGCAQPTPNPLASPTPRPTLFGQCFSPIDGCARGTVANCSIPSHYDFKSQCLEAMEQLSLDNCNSNTTNCSIYDLTVWVPN